LGPKVSETQNNSDDLNPHFSAEENGDAPAPAIS